jgi:hypothetical protein
VTFSDFFSSLGDLDWLAILVGTLGMYVFSAIWYGPLLGKPWSAGHGVSGGGTKMPSVDVLIMGLITTFVLNVGIAYFIPALHVANQQPSDIQTLIVSSLMLGVLVIGMALAGYQVYLKKPWSVWFIDTGYYVIGIAIAAYLQDLIN